MTSKKRNKLLATLAVAIIAFGNCTKKWDDHVAVTDNALTTTLAEAVKKTNNLGKFAELLAKSGYDTIISSSKTFTVWAPNDAALQNLDPAIVNDAARLRAFVGNHISYQSYLTTSGGQRIQMLNGKYNTMAGSKFDEATIVTANQYASNGIYHVIDKFVAASQNTWEFVNSTTVAPQMKAFLLSLNRFVFDPANATQTGVDPITGLPVYDSATGRILRNTFLDTIFNLNNEARQHTLILLTDAAYNNEYNKLSPWFKTSSADTTKTLTGTWLVKDLVFEGALTAAQLPDTMVSKYGVKVPINKSAIVASYKTSNGMVHLMSSADVQLSDKFPPLIIEGERPSGFVADRSANTFYRIRQNPATGKTFNDIVMTGYNYASYWINYRVRNVPSMRYNAYWVAVNDLQSTPLWSQRLGIDSTNNTTNLPAVTVAFQNYNEVLLGQFTVQNFKDLNLYLIGPTTASSSATVNVLSLDYIKLVPAF